MQILEMHNLSWHYDIIQSNNFNFCHDVTLEQ